MKLPELKSKFKNKYVIRIVAGALVVAMVGTGVSVSSVQAAKGVKTETSTEAVVEDTEDTKEAESTEDGLKDALESSIKINEKEIGKEETVYIIADAVGKAKQTIVSEHLLNKDNKATIEDVSSLKDIKNVKGDETFTQNGDKLTWQAEGNDIYYQGTATKETPVTQEITYYLDGKEIAPEELAGKSGKVTIRFDYHNNEKVEAKIDGKMEEVCVPFMAVSGMVLDDSFSNIEVTNGKVIADGKKNMIIGYTLPGLKESLNVDDEDFDSDINIPDYFEVTADVENFELGMTMTAVVNATNFISAEREDGESSVNELLDTLTDATNQLQDGSQALADGMDTLKSNLGEFADGVNTLKDGIKSYTDGAGQLSDGIGTLKKGIGSLTDNVPALTDGVNTLNTSAKSISDGITTLDNTLKKPLTDQEKAAYAAQASASVDATFAPGTDTYNYIFNTAKQSFENAMNGSADSVYLALRYNPDGSDGALYTNLFAAGYAQTLETKYQEYLAGQGMNPTAMELGAYLQGKGQFEAGAQAQIAAGVQAQVEGSLKTLAQGITGGMAAQGADTTAASVVEACKGASEQAAAGALVMGIESTKANIAASIEVKQSNGYSLVTGAQALSAGTKELAGKVPALADGAKQLSDGTKQLSDGATKLTANSAALNDGAAKLKDGTGAIVDGVGQLSDGAHELADGILTFNEEGIEKILNSYNGDIKPLMERIQAILDAGADYQTYTGIADGINGSVKFVYKTDAIKAEN